MRISEVYRGGRFGLSVEVFPPKTEQGDAALYATLEHLRPFAPDFVSCTYGAGGSTQTRTVDICRTIQQRFGLTATSHFTCVGSTRRELLDWLRFATEQGIGNIMALRGDPPRGATEFKPVAGGLSHANQLVELIRAEHPELGIGVAGYPERHPESSSVESDLRHLKTKVDAGADAIFTQLFYDNERFLRFRDHCYVCGIDVPIVPGIMPITEFARIKRITALCGATIPQRLAAQLEAVQDDLPAQFRVGVDFAIAQCRQLLEEGIPGMHLYALNKSEACDEILRALSLPR